MKFSRYLLASLFFGVMFFLNSCQEELETSTGIETDAPEDGEMIDITLNFYLEDIDGLGTPTRADGNIASYLSDIDILVYALRDENDKVLYQYGRGLLGDLQTANGQPNVAAYPCLENYRVSEDNNQTLMPVTWVPVNSLDENGEIIQDGQEVKGPYKLKEPITLRVMRGTVYKLSCWAQNRNCTAYDFNYLTAVKVNYDGALNNDKSRDAFCATSKFSIGQVDSEVSVTLTRPFAQINVCINSSVDKSNYENYKQSQISLDGVATYFNVVENRAWSLKDYENWENGIFGQHYNKAIFNNTDRKPEFTANDVVFSYNEYTIESLEIHDYSKFEEGKPKIETYNSLSMCYVLVPEATYKIGSDNTIIDGAENLGDGSSDSGIIAPSLENVQIKLKSISLSDGSSGSNEVSYPKNGESKDISVKRNWRTNLLFEEWGDLAGTTSN